jgi:hypothetical protein
MGSVGRTTQQVDGEFAIHPRRCGGADLVAQREVKHTGFDAWFDAASFCDPT